MGKKKLDENGYDRILQLNKDGYDSSEISKIVGVTATRVRQILLENGIRSINKRYLNFSEEDCRKIVQLYREGISAVKIGKMFGCSKNPITKILHENGIELDTVLRAIPKDDYYKVIDMYNSGLTQREIANIYGCSANVVYNIMRQMNIPARPNGLTKEYAEQMYELYSNGMKLPEIAELYNVEQHTVGRVLKRNGFKTDRKTYHCDEHYFDSIDNQDKAYIAGLLWSDGCNQLNKGKVTIQLQERDINILEQIKIVSNNERPLFKSKLHDKNPNWQNSIVLTWQSRNISQVLNDYGMVPRKSLVLEFPNWLDKTLYSHFLRGYIDGDGSIYFSKDRNAIRVSMVGTSMFLSVVKNICFELGVKTYMSHKNEQNDITYSLATTSNSGSFALLNWIYQDANLKLQRKYDKYQQALDYCNINNTLVS